MLCAGDGGHAVDVPVNAFVGEDGESDGLLGFAVKAQILVDQDGNVQGSANVPQKGGVAAAAAADDQIIRLSGTEAFDCDADAFRGEAAGGGDHVFGLHARRF